MKINYKVRINNYMRDVLSGKRAACRYERLAVERYFSDLKNKKWVFNEKEALRFCNFFSLLKHYKGDKAGQQFVLEPWQAFAVWNIYGWQERTTLKRRFMYADIIVPRKNGKSTFAAGLGLAAMMIDHEMGAEVYSAGMDREQAKVVWDTAKTMAEQSPSIRQYLQLYKTAIVMESTVSSFKPLSRDVKNKDGSNPHMAICDERHAWKTNEMFDVLRSGLGARRQPLILSITTAGKDTSVPYFSQMEFLKKLLEGSVTQENQFAMIFTPDEGDDWRDPKVWAKVNPNWGVSLSKDYIAKECDVAVKRGGTTEANFKTKNLNMWVDAPDIWIKDDAVAACDLGTDLASLQGKRCFAGLDLASHVDFNALALLFPDSEPKCAVMHFWIPEAKINDPDMSDRMDYRLWHERGFIHSIPGNVLDPVFIANDIANILKQYKICNLSFDPWKAYHGTIQNLQDRGLGEYLDEYSQTMAHMSEPTKTLESWIYSQGIDLMANPVLRWMFSNVVIKQDLSGNIKVDRKDSKKKVDGVVALVNAIGGWLSKTAKDKASVIYSSHELRTIRM